MPNRSLLDVLDAAIGPVHPGNLGRVRSTAEVPDGAQAGGRCAAGRTAPYLDLRDDGHRADEHQLLRKRLVPYRMRT